MCATAKEIWEVRMSGSRLQRDQNVFMLLQAVLDIRRMTTSTFLFRESTWSTATFCPAKRTRDESATPLTGWGFISGCKWERDKVSGIPFFLFWEETDFSLGYHCQERLVKNVTYLYLNAHKLISQRARLLYRCPHSYMKTDTPSCFGDLCDIIPR